MRKMRDFDEIAIEKTAVSVIVSGNLNRFEVCINTEPFTVARIKARFFVRPFLYQRFKTNENVKCRRTDSMHLWEFLIFYCWWVSAALARVMSGPG